MYLQEASNVTSHPKQMKKRNKAKYVYTYLYCLCVNIIYIGMRGEKKAGRESRGWQVFLSV